MSQLKLQKRLEQAVASGDVAETTAAIAAGARVNRKLPGGSYALVMAAERGNIGMIATLRLHKTRKAIWRAALKASADPTTAAVIREGHTPVPKPLGGT